MTSLADMRPPLRGLVTPLDFEVGGEQVWAA